MPDAPVVSIVIPTHKRPQILRKCLEHLERQTIIDQIEVIVVNDGDELKIDPSTGSTELVLSQPKDSPQAGSGGELRIPIRVLNVSPCHQGTARNCGVRLASGRFVLFIGDDIFLASDACEKHVDILNSQFSILNSIAVLGFTTWDPACGITPVMKWLERSGWQFGYPMLRPFVHSIIPSAIQHRFTYTSHISLPTEIARQFPFREDVTLYGWEDIEWGWRLAKAGVRLFYEPDAKALHHHHITLEDSLKRMETLGRSAVVMEKLVPELELVPKGWKKWKYRIAAMLPGMRGRHSKAFLKGIATGIHSQVFRQRFSRIGSKEDLM